MTPALAILLSKQVDRVIADANTRTSPFINRLYDVCKEAIEHTEWEGVYTNSQTLSAALVPNYWPPADQFNPVALCTYLWDCTHVLAFWAGGPNFQQVLEASLRMRRKVRLYAVDIDKLTLNNIEVKRST